MNCIAIDDEPLAINVIKEFCSKIDYLNLLATFNSAVEAIKLLNQTSVDLIFLDIQMPHISGLEFIKSIPNPPMVVFTTAYSEHALQGFELNAIDYLVKPIPFERFFKAVNKAYELYNLRKKNELSSNLTLERNSEHQADYFMIKVEYSTVKVDFKDIQYIEGLKDYVKIYTGPRPILTKTTMKNIEEKLSSDNFVRIHKSYIVSISHIKAIENNRVLIGDKRIPVGEQYKEAFYKIVNKNKL